MLQELLENKTIPLFRVRMNSTVLSTQRMASAPPGRYITAANRLTHSGGTAMRYLHTMVRVSDIEESLDFYADKLGLKEVRRTESQQGRFTLIFLAADENPEAQVELTYNWDPEVYTGGRNFGHLAYSVADIYATCQQLMDKGVTINRPPRDGRMAFVKSPDGISIELLQQGEALPPREPGPRCRTSAAGRPDFQPAGCFQVRARVYCSAVCAGGYTSVMC